MAAEGEKAPLRSAGRPGGSGGAARFGGGNGNPHQAGRTARRRRRPILSGV